jgi:hypothetical protein
MCVGPGAARGRIGQRLYDARKSLGERLELKGVVIGGRLPNYARSRRKVEGPEDYLAKAAEGRIKDPVFAFQLKNGFEPIGLLKDYLPEDKQSGGNAAHLVWRNPYVDPSEPAAFRVPRGVESVRLATCQLQMRAVKSFEEFVCNIEYFVDVAADYRSDFIVFPELLTLQLLAFEKRDLTPMEAIDRLTDHTPKLTAELSRMALEYNINIIGGSHPTRTEAGDIQNVAYVCLRDGSIHAQEKIHPTPNERYWWKIKGGDRIDAIQTDCGPIGVSSATTANSRSSPGAWPTKARASCSSPSAPTTARAICAYATAARRVRSRTSASSSCPAMSAICRTSRIWTSNMHRAAS